MKCDFEKFRKYFGAYAEAPSPWTPPVGEGWHGLIYDALFRIDKIVGGDAAKFKIDQIKEKFGSLCFYHSADESVRDALDKIEVDLEKKSERTCEECGKPAEIHDYKSWHKCWCRDRGAKFIFENRVLLGARGWKLGKIGGRVVLIDKATGQELGDAKFNEIDARVEVNRATQKRESDEGRRVSSVRSAASAEIKFWRHACFLARR